MLCARKNVDRECLPQVRTRPICRVALLGALRVCGASTEELPAGNANG
jgi:hypothetical protein